MAKKPKPNCWKVIKKRHRTSAFATRELTVRYHAGSTVIAPVGGLLAFKTKRDAENFFYGNRHIAVPAFGNQRVPLPPTRALYARSLSMARLAWSGKSISKDGFCDAWPRGTVAYKEITVLE